MPNGKIWPLKLQIPEEVLNHICTKRQRKNEMVVVEGLSLSHAYEDSTPNLDDDGIESELRTLSSDDEEDAMII
ncbi:hypothetical protein M5K25_000836 [Dendrobium thyrsiflorum]|uniref:Uncharacterized protein n=1 Tax=Dendrobium thyrsiflorum TaxID=117978 RepID=A0ABD0VV84_DENTH